jgi:ABC-type sugar transport system substrate-binding protein
MGGLRPADRRDTGEMKMRGRASRFVGGVCASMLAATLVFCIGGSGAVRAEDRLLGMVEPVKAKKPYRIAYSSADMNADFFLALAYGVLDEAQQACDADALRRGPDYGASFEQNRPSRTTLG